MYKNILVPLDNSVTDQVILDHVQALAKFSRAKLVLIHVADGFAARYKTALNLVDSEEITKDKKYLDETEKSLKSLGIEVKSYLEYGEPANQILTIAEKEGCDLIAMSTHGHRFLSDLFWGSVATSIRHRTNIPVLMIRAGK